MSTKRKNFYFFLLSLLRWPRLNVFFLLCEKHIQLNINILAQFPVGLDCIFHFRGVPYSRWAFFQFIYFFLGSLVADCPISRHFYHTSQAGATWYRIKSSIYYLFGPCLVVLSSKGFPEQFDTLCLTSQLSWRCFFFVVLFLLKSESVTC